MKIMDFLSEDAITVDLKSVNKTDAIKELSDLLINAGEIDKKDKGKVVELLMAREALGSTAIGHNVGIPHTKVDGIEKLIAAFGLSRKGVEFVGPPEKQAWGGIMTHVRDVSDNTLSIVQMLEGA